MSSRLSELFISKEIIYKIESKLPRLFQIAQIEASRGGKTGMEVGVTREKILVALLISIYGGENVNTDVDTTKSEIDAYLFNKPISIKTVTGNGTGVKAVWTVDQDSARRFADTYKPECDILLTTIKWGHSGGLHYIPIEAQTDVLQSMRIDDYLKLPKAGTNPRGVEFSAQGMSLLMSHQLSKKISIRWIWSQIDYNPYKRWVDYWLLD